MKTATIFIFMSIFLLSGEPSPLQLPQDTIQLGGDRRGQAYIRLGNDARSEQMVFQVGERKPRACQYDLEGGQSNDYIVLRELIYPRELINNPFTVCAWHKGYEGSKSCTSVYFDYWGEENETDSGTLVDTIAAHKLCIDGTLTYVPLLMK